MKKGLVFAYIIFLSIVIIAGLILILFSNTLHRNQADFDDESDISDTAGDNPAASVADISTSDADLANECNSHLDLVIPATMELAHSHGKGRPCYLLFSRAYYDNNVAICNRLNNEKAKAICLGGAVQTWEDKNLCSSLSQEEYKEICILNIIRKIYISNQMNYPSKIDICENIQSDYYRKICLDYKSLISSNYTNITDSFYDGEGVWRYF